MKKVIASAIIALTLVFGASAQTTQTQNEFSVSATYLNQNLEGTLTTVERPTYRIEANSFGVAAGYTRYNKGIRGNVGTVGVTTEIAANFTNSDTNLFTAQAGLIAKGRNYEWVQPSVRIMGGIGRQSVNNSNFRDFSTTSGVFTAGAGLDFNLAKSSRYKIHTGLDYTNVGFRGEREHGAKASIGLVF